MQNLRDRENFTVSNRQYAELARRFAEVLRKAPV